MTYVEYVLGFGSLLTAPFVGEIVRQRTQVATAKVIARVFR